MAPTTSPWTTAGRWSCTKVPLRVRQNRWSLAAGITQSDGAQMVASCLQVIGARCDTPKSGHRHLCLRLPAPPPHSRDPLLDRRRAACQACTASLLAGRQCRERRAPPRRAISLCERRRNSRLHNREVRAAQGRRAVVVAIKVGTSGFFVSGGINTETPSDWNAQCGGTSTGTMVGIGWRRVGVSEGPYGTAPL